MRKGKKLSHEHCIKIAVANRNETPYKNLSDELIKRQLSYRALAKILNLSASTVSNRMNGLFDFTIKDIAKLTEFFNLPAEYLLKRFESHS
ncbi:MAG: helix-turn-helix domain-containing protein [Selenomonadaceae bacterium]|nr:helix-turn-helix domain-containing protein [Selenomonadaceae bacterium]MBR6887388.1 helix-turn-helix domain-containing protein [Selenomonadaceae bacterium]